MRLVDEELANNFGIAAMLSVICQGIDCIAVLESFITVDTTAPWANSTSRDPDPRLNGSDELVNANLPNARETERFSSQAFGKRFIATFNIRNQHWVATIFDQVKAHLYIYDTISRGRRARAKACGLAWRAFALNLNLPCGFRVFCPPLPPQPGEWECGYLGLVNIHQSIRALMGKKYQGTDGFPVSWLEADGRAAKGVIACGAPMLLIPDWTFGAVDEREGWCRANTILRAIMCNELGISLLANLRKVLPPNKRQDECSDFSFRKSAPGELISLVLHMEGPWRNKDTVDGHAPLYAKDGSRMMVGLHEGPTVPHKPTSWAPFRAQILRNVYRRYASSRMGALVE